MKTNLECILLLDRERLHRGGILPHLLEGMERVVRTSCPTTMARAGGVLRGIDEASNDAP